MAKLTPEGQKEVMRYIEFLLWKRQKEILAKIPDEMLLEEVRHRNLAA